MKERMKKITAITASASMLAVLFAGCNQATEAKTEDAELKTNITQAQTLAAPEHSDSAGKNETVYIIKKDNETTETIVSDWLKNSDGAASLDDIANLSDIEVVRGNSTLTDNGDGQLTWSTDGGDVYYSGTTTEQAPVDVDVSYTLDGEAITGADLEGKSGHLVITIDYTNNMSEEYTDDNGEKYTVYMPFVMSTGMLLDSTKVTNVTVDNGEAVNDGEHTVVMGVGFPGLEESLDLDSLKTTAQDESDDDSLDDTIASIDIPESLVVECDVTDCDEITSMTVAKKLDLSDSDFDLDTDSLSDKADDMTDGMSQLTDGASDLCDGAETLNDGASELSDGAGRLSDGASTLASGAASLSEGSSSVASGASTLLSGSQTLNNGISQVNSGAAALKDGLTQLAGKLPELQTGVEALQTGVSQISDGMSTLTSKNDTLNNGASTLANGLSQLNQAMNSMQTTALAQGSANVLGAINNMYTNAVAPIGMTSQQEAALEALISGTTFNADPAVNAQYQAQLIGVIRAYSGLATGVTGLYNSYSGINTAIQALPTVAANVSALSDGAATLKNGISDYTAGVNQVASGVAQLKSSLPQLATGAGNLATAVSQLNTGAATLSEGTASLASGSSSLVSGANRLSAGAQTLASGAKSLAGGAGTVASGASSVSDGSKTLADGTAKLLDGAQALSDGLNEFNDEAVTKITSLINDNIEPLSGRINALKSYSADYDSFAGTPSDVECSTVFVFKNT